jgi:RNA polymerase II C-terminal domain phosphatase-like 3/4
VVALHAGTVKALWAVKNKKFLLHPRWIEACNYRWRRLPEEGFPVPSSKIKGKEKIAEDAVAAALINREVLINYKFRRCVYD